MDVNFEAARRPPACQVMHRHFLALSSTRVLCKIGSARLPTEGKGLAAVIDQLNVLQVRVSRQLERLVALSIKTQAVALYAVRSEIGDDCVSCNAVR